MEKKLSNVLEDVDDLVNYIKDSDNYKRYIEVRDKLKDNKEIMGMINEVKSLQKKIVRLEHDHKPIDKEDKKINDILTKLEEYPIYNEYNYLIEDLNYELDYVKKTIEDVINKAVN